jgi:NADH-quinone oxidoreductase subunit N
MTSLDFLTLAPFLIISGAPIIIMLTISISRHYKVIFGFSLIAFLAAFLSLFFVMPYAPHSIEPLFVIDSYSLLFLGIIYFTSFLITILSFIYLNHYTGVREEYFIILFVAALGASILVISKHFISFFLGLETLSISLFILIAYIRSRDQCIEAGVKYLVMASASTAILLFGLALIYVATGTMEFSALTSSIGNGAKLSPIILAGLGMIIAGIGFKLALVPFHMWAPDVYQGAPAPVSAFIATISKGAVMALILRFFIDIRAYQIPTLILIISIIAVVSMFAGNLMALRQTNLKRLLAYSSIAHVGYLMITLLTSSDYGIHAAIFYLVVYMITSLGAFAIIGIFSNLTGHSEDIGFYKGLFYKKPWVAIVFTLILLSLAGIPLTAGFMGKFYLVLAGAKSGLWILVISLIVNSVISLYYYLRVVVSMFSASDEKALPAVPFLGNFVLGVIAVSILLLGILPGWLIDFISSYSGMGF